ncbi:SprB repeat-containing protein [Hymenobacter convexus]|uniref:SprB repeat-containing protein n=1 Tax=Hymenobacter sp. CA1UV-4 TaxID=3063782 RepID=UPI0027135E1B|nr:SprB repeat-containing protein [Hymenobacter sp. CA1UV-4]MDO7852304.1 SprB repeat-containing protein [Hymenobacter sp. CA1UV-4]
MGSGLASTVVAGVNIAATAYDPAFDFQLPVCSPVYVNGSTGFSWLTALSNTIRPVFVAVAVTNTGGFGTRTGAIALVASNGTVGTYTYLWADAGAPLTAGRTGLAAGTYSCTVTDASGASTVAVAVVASDARLDVLVALTDNNVTLTPSGGVGPYTYLWNDGPTTGTRGALGVGTYTCIVTDSRGTTREVTVTIDPYRFYWSKKPVTLSLDAGPAYRLDPTIKPNLSFVCEVWVEEVYRSGTFVQVGPTQEQPADRSGRTVFDAQELLDAYLTDHLPDLNQAVPSRADCLFRRFYFRYAEKFGTPAVAAPLSNQAQHYVVFGGLDFYEATAGTWFSS